MPDNQPSRPRASVLLLYQGDIAHDVVDQLLLEFRKHSDFELIKVSDNDGTFDVELVNECTDKIQNCKAAIAVVAPDPRNSIKAGNIWFEIGLWCGLRSKDTLWFAVAEEVGDDLPTDVVGHAEPRFKSVDQLCKQILGFLDNLSRRGAFGEVDTDYDAEQKVYDTIVRRWNSAGNTNRLYQCGNRKDGTDCAYRREFTRFLSELLRMGRSNREHAVIEDCIHQMPQILESIIPTLSGSRLTEIKNPVAVPKRRTEIRKLTKVLRRLRQTSELLLERKNRPGTEPWQRVYHYLCYRMEVAQKVTDNDLRNRLQEDTVSLPDLLSGLPDFIKWAANCEDASSGYGNSVIYVASVKDANEHMSRLYDMLRMTTGIGIVLEYFGQVYFGLCRDIIKTGLAQAGGMASMPTKVEGIRRGLPHNNSKVILPKIWPSSEAAERK